MTSFQIASGMAATKSQNISRKAPTIPSPIRL